MLFCFSEIFPYLVVIIGLENILVITKSVVTTPVHLEVKLRIAQGWNLLSLFTSSVRKARLLIALAPRYRYCSGANFTVAVAPLLLAESSGDSSAATFLSALNSAIRFLALFATATFKKEN